MKFTGLVMEGLLLDEGEGLIARDCEKELSVDASQVDLVDAVLEVTDRVAMRAADTGFCERVEVECVGAGGCC